MTVQRYASNLRYRRDHGFLQLPLKEKTGEGDDGGEKGYNPLRIARKQR
ncbi:MAG: hypothetical protein OEV42_09895 [Deltaproteobacteria bacterium]|nr:hypothetical protein [Deltaproteobacteria bacterium]